MRVFQRSQAERLSMWVVALLLAVYCAAAWSPPHLGDDIEYLAMSEAFVRHGTPDVRPGDLRVLAERNLQDQSIVHLVDIILPQMRQGENYFGFYRDAHSRFYSYHFWLYSLIAAPAMALCQLVGVPSRNAFLLTNAALFLALSALVLFGTDWRFRRKLLLVALAFGCGSTFYLRASIPESMCFSLVLAGLVLLETRRYDWALFAFAVAAQQNPPIGFLAVIAGCLAAWQIADRMRKTHWHWSRLEMGACMALLLGGLLLVASPLFYYAHFGVPSLIIADGSTAFSLISWRRLLSLLFDYNQGMVLAMPGVFLVSLALLFPVGRSSGRTRLLALGLVAIMLAMAVPTLTQVNWNSDDAIIARYAYWLSAPLIFACAMLMDAALGAMSFAMGAAALMASQVGVLATFGLQGTAYTYTEPSPLAEWLLDHHQGWYRPLPEIYVERGTHENEFLSADLSYLYVEGGYLRTILAHSDPVVALSMLCHVDQSALHSHVSEQGWRYWDLKRYCPSDWTDGVYAWPQAPNVLEPGHFTRLAEPYLTPLLPGLSRPEKNGTWTRSKRVVMPLFVRSTSPAQDGRGWRITLAFWPFVHPPGAPGQQVFISANHQAVFQRRYTRSKPETASFVAHPQPLGDKGALLLEFLIPTAVSPKQLGVSSDPRELGIKLINVRAQPL